jgi:lysophospholipase L1-like esterase
MIGPGRRSFAVPLGCVLIGTGLLLSGRALEATIFPSGTIVGTARRATALMTGRVALAGLGTYLLTMRPRITAVHLTAWALAALAALFVGAVGLQLFYVPPPIVSGWKAFAPKAEQNQLGFRGRPINYAADDYVVVLLGDSQVEGYGLSFDAMPERFLESQLRELGHRVKVFSIGAGGYGQDQELLALEEYFRTNKANLVVLWQSPTNDIWNNLFNTHMASRNPKPTFWLDQSGKLRGPSESPGQRLATSRIVVITLFERAFGLPWRDKSWEQRLPEAYRPLDRYEGPVRTEWQERWRTDLARMRDEELDTEKSHLAVVLTPRSRRMQYGLDLTRALTQRIQNLVIANRGHLVVFQTNSHDITEDGEQVYVLNDKYYRTSKHQYQANWAYVNDGFDVEIVPITVQSWRVAPDDGHLNAKAAEQVMTDLAARLQARITDGRVTATR